MMLENEVLNRLGLKDIDELKTFLDFSDRSEKIKYFCSDFRMPSVETQKIEWNPKENYYYLPGIADIEANSSYYRRGWKTVLRPNSTKQDGNSSKVKGRPKGYPAGNIPKGETAWYFDRGHIFARRFHQYVIDKKVLYKKYEDRVTKGKLWSESHIDCLEKNIFTQFSLANKAQAEVEKEISELLSKKDPVYFEVKVVFRNQGDILPIGTELFFTQLPNPDEVKHYFIPNIDVGFDLSKAKFDYSNFYNKGCQEAMRVYFKDSDRKIHNYRTNKGKPCTVERTHGNITFHLSKERSDRLKEYVVQNYKILQDRRIQNAQQIQFKQEKNSEKVNLSINFFDTGTVVIQGNSMENFIDDIEEYL